MIGYRKITCYKYNADGIRTSKTVNGVTTKYTLDGSNVVVETNGTDTIWYYYDASGSLTGFELNGTAYFYVKNMQGDIVAIVNSSGTKAVEYLYDSWGKLISTTGSLASTVGAKNPYRYRGYRYDTETGLYYVSSRYYDPEIRRFINADDIILLGANRDFASYDLFAYCGNNPLTRKDSDGYAWEIAFDLVSLATSIIEVSCNPYDVGAWIGLVGDIIDVAVPFVAGVGETVRIVNTGRKITDVADDINDTRRVVSKIHGNSLSSNRINYGYQLIDKNNNVVKYGESKNPLTRYSQKWLNDNGYRVQIKVAGTKRGVHEWQHDMIENYALISGGRPVLNRSLW